MSLKPGTLCKLKKGQLIDTHEHFVDTFNWMVDFINNIKGDWDVQKKKGSISVKKTTSDEPVIEYKGGKVFYS